MVLGDVLKAFWPHIVGFQIGGFEQHFESVLTTHSGLLNSQFWAMFLEDWLHIVGF